MFDGQRWWIVGASEGLGRALAQHMDRRGARLILSARSRDRLEALAGSLRQATALPVDVTDSADVARAVNRAGLVDGVIYCVGEYDPMTAQDWNVELAERMCEANFTGAVRVLGRVVPDMARRDGGSVVLIGSLAGYSGLPGAIGYGASKAALMHLAENMQADLRGTGVRVRLVNPGFIRTRLTDKNSFDMPFIVSPEQAAERVVRAIEGRGFATAFPMLFSWLFRAGRFLPRSLFLRLFPR